MINERAVKSTMIGCYALVFMTGAGVLWNVANAQSNTSLIDPTPSGIAKEMSEQAKVVAEHDRIITGLQKQVTVLHAKKANVQDIEGATKRMNGIVARSVLLEQRVAMLEKKMTHVVNILKLKRENGK